MVVDRQMHRLPSDPAGVALAVPVAGDAVTDAIELAELLDVDVEDLARGGALITADRLGRLERGQAVEAQPFQDAADGGGRNADFGGDLLACTAVPTQSLDLASTLAHGAGAVWLGDERGRDERSCKPATPSARKRRTHLATVFGVTLNWRAAAAWLNPPSTTARTIASFAVRGAFLWLSIRFSANRWRFGDFRVPGPGRMDNLLKDHS
jgi:hypothetical protein